MTKPSLLERLLIALGVLPFVVLFLGDNRDRSSDSRYWGAVPGENLRGRVVLLFSWLRGFRRV